MIRSRLPILVLASLAALPVAGISGTLFDVSGPSANNVDTNPGTFVSLTAPDLGSIINLSVSVNLDANYADDVSVYLIHGATTVQLYNGIGDTGGSYMNATFADSAASAPPANGTADGTFKPVDSLSAFTGQSLSGTWQLELLDKVVAGDGTNLTSWSISGTAGSAAPEPFTMTLAGAGLGAIALARKRRSKGDSRA